MNNPLSDYVKLVLGVRTSSHSKYVIALRATADYYGWTKELEEWTPKPLGTSGGYVISRDPGRRGGLQHAGGKRLRICRSPNRAGNPAGLTNAFRVTGRCGLLDLSELAHFTTCDWYWMEGPYGERISRERWEEIYQAG